MTSYSILKTKSLGDLLLVASETKLTGIYFTNGKHAPDRKSDWADNPSHPVLKKVSAQIEEYLQGKRRNFSIPLASSGTDFQRAVWQQIERIPFGETISYTELAKRAGAPKASRAAGAATGRNPFTIIVPCHRVVGKDGGLGGYAGGLNRKKRLLEVETPEIGQAPGSRLLRKPEPSRR
jgi:methylated-DNA-[protein]-cysteine S-methyltransferase